MKKIILVLMVVLLAVTPAGCGGSDDCGMCNGSGYYQKKTCPACNGSGHSDYDPYEQYSRLYD